MKITFLFSFVFLCATTHVLAQPLLLQKPALNNSQISFVYADDLWIVGREGGNARQLTTDIGLETDPHFSPDGSRIAFTGNYDGNPDVYVVSANGGKPQRLTYHPGEDNALGWTPDGKQVLFRSDRKSYSSFDRLFTVPLKEGSLTEIPLPMAFEGSFSPDFSHIAYVPIHQWQPAWKRYRGGQAKPIWIAKLSDSTIERLPREDSNDFNPMWIGNKIYFLSDRKGAVTLFSYDTDKKTVRQLVENDGFDMKSASADDGAIVYEQFGNIFLFDLKLEQSRKLDIRVTGDFPLARPHFEKIKREQILNAKISPTGARVAFEAHGEVLTVPKEKGDIRNISRTTGAAERDPAWSPDGKQLAYFSDESGEYRIHLRNQSGLGDVRKINLGNPPSFFYSPVWSPDGKKIAYTDKRLSLWYVDLEKGTPVRVDSNTYESLYRNLNPSWSPDSQWLTYTRDLKNHMSAVFVYSLRESKTYQITDAMSDAKYAVFDKSGKYLYFSASTDVGPTTAWIDLSSVERPVSRSIYIVVLRKEQSSPIAPESDEEKGAEAKAMDDESKSDASKKDKEAKKEPSTVRIDLENIDQRMLALPIPPRNYSGLKTGKENILFLLETPAVILNEEDLQQTLSVFDLEKRKLDKLHDGVNGFDVSLDGEMFLYQKGDKWTVAPAVVPPNPEQEKVLKLDTMEIYVDPPAEWKQMFHEVWRLERDFFYDPNLHGLDWKASKMKYEPYLDGLASRNDLNYLFTEMLGELTVGHLFVEGGDLPEANKTKGGLLGADYEIANGRYRFARVYNGENWNPDLRAPLTQPGVNVKEGEYLLAVNGREVYATENLYSFFEETAGKSVVLQVGPDPKSKNAREVTVVPVESEQELRRLAWIEDNRRKVDQLSGGRIAYVYLPDTAQGGYTNFNRYFFAQLGKEGLIVDERFNGGGFAADYVVDYLRRPLLNYWTTREGEDFTTPLGAIFGPKAMIINEMAGSGGDAMPWYFRKLEIGPLIGKRTWGGLVGIYDYPQLMDGGLVTAPRVAFWSPKGEWDVENRGVSPDVEVEYDPAAVRKGHDPQLEKAIAVVLEELKKNPLPIYKKPAYPNYHTD